MKGAFWGVRCHRIVVLDEAAVETDKCHKCLREEGNGQSIWMLPAVTINPKEKIRMSSKYTKTGLFSMSQSISFGPKGITRYL